MTDTLDEIQKLIDNGKGDTERLRHILKSLKSGKQLYSSDRTYLESLLYPEKTTEVENSISNSFIITTTNNVDGYKISDYLGIVSGEAVMGSNIFRDVFAGVTDIIGGRSGQYEKKFRDAKNVALTEMIASAKENGANAVVGVKIDYEMVRESMMMVSTQGTAVKLVQN